MMEPVVRNHTGNRLSPVFAGLVYAMLVAGTATVVLSLLLAATGLKEQSLPLYVYVIHGFSVLTGGFVTAKRAAEKGWYKGGLLGVLYGLIVWLVSFLGFDVGFSLQTIYFWAGCFLVGAIGGIFGINAGR